MLTNMRVFITFRVFLYPGRKVATGFANITGITRVLDKDPTLLREGRFKRFISLLKKNHSIDNDTYTKIFPKGSQPAKFYGLPKLHKKRENHNQPPLRRIVSSIGAYNYN